ncbi:tyrosine-protein phosphatase [Fundicoccus culcitae]|uniref:Tyrosine-protein phosphatase n=1 Tax=Fundicoccus culcitae TaxID=2969821 RepID=A0ABY5P284_9LACT|nr:tyrosine-protein phosphatase [Fundicoccus culcitae]UUX32749.1 tyrosine-protein phosphatase [Fundicoccus culcitae]
MITTNYVRLPLQAVNNCREMGGYATADGKVTRWHNFLRSSQLSNSTADDIQFLIDYGLKTIIDLRTTEEINKQPNPFSDDDNVAYYHQNFMQKESIKDINSMPQLANEEFALGKMYTYLLSHHEAVKSIMDIVLNHKEGTLLFHCSAGKDRTGVVALLILGIAGVSLQDIVTNYEVTYTNIMSDFKHLDTKYTMNMIQSHPQNIIMAYEYILNKYLSFEAYFVALGYSADEIQQFKAMIVE